MVNENHSSETGQFETAYPDGAFLEALDELGDAGTQEVADEVGCRYETAYKRLKRFRDDGEVTSRKVGNALLWTLADE